MADSSATDTARDPGPTPAVYSDTYLEDLQKKWDFHEVKQAREAGIAQRRSLIKDACKTAAFQFSVDVMDYLLDELRGRHELKRDGTHSTPSCVAWAWGGSGHNPSIQIKKMASGIRMHVFVHGRAVETAIHLHAMESLTFDPDDIYKKLVDYVVPAVITKDWSTFT